METNVNNTTKPQHDAKLLVMRSQIELLEQEIRSWSLLMTKQPPSQTLRVIEMIADEVEWRVKKVESLKAQFGFA